MKFILNRLKALLLTLIGYFRRSLCCFRSRIRTHDEDSDDCLTDVGIVPNRNEQDNMWDNKWEEDQIKKPQTIQDHIQMYREKIAQPYVAEPNREDEALENLFQELTPRYVKQERILVNNYGANPRSHDSNLSRLSVSEGRPMSDLGEWVDEGDSGWDEHQFDPMDVLKEQRRLKRESRQQNTGLGRKLKT